MRIRLRVVVFALALFAATAAQAQEVVATSGLNVRAGKTKSSAIKGHLSEGDTADLALPNKSLGYYRVRTRTGVTGWSWAARLKLVTATPAPSTPPLASATTTAATTIDDNWTKTPTNAHDIHWAAGNHALCQAGGVGGDEDTNAWKNRDDEPPASAVHAVTWDALATLPFPRNQKKHRAGSNAWTSAELGELAKFEGLAVSVEGFLSGVKEQIPSTDSHTHQRGHGESTNCGENTSPRVDWHMYLTKAPHQSHKLSVVIETTPRVRPGHPAWTVAKMKQLSDNGTPVRVTGWVMFDPEHWDQMWKYKNAKDTTGIKARITLWEIHPITKIEVRTGGVWRSLDTP